ncbi:MAG: sugar transferase [Planctomycetota bacterium]
MSKANAIECGAPPVRPMQAAVKRGFDVVSSAVVLLLTAPLLALVALLIKCTSPGPVFYRARRAGRFGVPFAMLKFRTMRTGTDSHDRKITDDGDDRITPLGRLLRATKIDELPQLWNVLRGDMSIVGPRPEDQDLVDRHYTPALRRALETRPGIACTAEVRWYPDLTWHDPPPPGVPLQQHYIARHLPAQAAEGVRYRDTQSLWLDLSVIARTLWCVAVHSLRPPARRPLTDADLRAPEPPTARTPAREACP